MTTPVSKTLPTIHILLGAILQDIEAISKDEQHKQGFRFRGIDSIYNHLHGVFKAHGVVCLPLVTSHRNEIVPWGEKKATRTIVEVKYTFHGPAGDSVEMSSVGEGMDLADKSTPKALSMAHKYALIQAFLIPTADLIDADDYDPTLDLRAEIDNMRKEIDRKDGIGEGEATAELPEAQVVALTKKREEAQALADKNGNEGITAVTPAAPAPETPAQPAAETPKRTRKKTETPAPAPETLAQTAPAEPAPQQPAAPEEPNPLSDAEEAAPALPASYPTASQNYVTAVIRHPDFKEKRLGDLPDADLSRLFKGWVLKHGAEALATKSPGHAAEVDMITAEFTRRGLQ